MFGDPSGMAPEKHQKGGGDVLLGSGSLAAYFSDIATSTSPGISYTIMFPIFDIIGYTYTKVYRATYAEDIHEEPTYDKPTTYYFTGLAFVGTRADPVYGVVGYNTSTITEGGLGVNPSYGYGPGGGESSANDNSRVSRYNLAPLSDKGKMDNMLNEIGNLIKTSDNGDSYVSIVVLLDKEGANGFGHMAIIMPDYEGKLHYYSKDGTSEENGIFGEALWTHKVKENSDFSPESVSEFIDEINKTRKGDHAYETISYAELKNPNLLLLHNTADCQISSYYDVTSNSCAHTLYSVIWADRLDMFGVGKSVINWIKKRAGKALVFPTQMPYNYYNNYEGKYNSSYYRSY